MLEKKIEKPRLEENCRILEENLLETMENSRSELEEHIQRMDATLGQPNLAVIQPQVQEMMKQEVIQATPTLHERSELPIFDDKTPLAVYMTLFETDS